MTNIKQLIMTLVALLAVTTGAWAQTGENIFQFCYDCQRSPAYPTAMTSASLSGFQNPYVGYKDMDNTSDGPWKLEYMGIWSTTDNHGIDDVSYYQSTYNCTDVPVFRLYQWNATANEYQHAAYGVVCCYAKVSNAVEHTALFVAQGGWGCVLTNSSHSSSMNITFDEDLTTGLTTLIAAATPAASGTPVPLTWDAATPKTATLTNGMPAGNVTVSVEYFAQAELATSTGETPVALAPAAIAGVPANTDDPIVTAGTVANIGTSEVKQGTLMYFVSQSTGNTAPEAPDYDAEGWSEDVPTANGLAQGNAYVWYYIKGAEPAQVTDRTDANTCSDSDIMPLGTTGFVTLDAEPTYDVTLNAEGLSDEEAAAWKAGKGTDQPAAFPLEGVKKGETVTVTYTGTKKVLGVKAEKKVEGPTLNLATVTEATTVEDGYTVIGTLGENVKISIAAGATVTLDGVTINGEIDNSYKWAGINCLGDATIILSGTNTVKGFHHFYPGIHVPVDKTLTIQGSGSLTASSNGQGCGIGGGYEIACGNIVIAGGTITANGGGNAASIGGGAFGSCGNISFTGGTVNATGDMSAAAIGSGQGGSCGDISITGGTINANGGTWAAGIGSGSGSNALCGNISITGGTVNANGGESGAGIGSGWQSSCGTVTITDGVTSVTATMGQGASYSIGAGNGGSCGTVTIGGTKYWENNAAVGDGATYLAQDQIVYQP